jgi:DNA polymerase
LFKLHATTGRRAKVENTPEHCFFNNDNVNGVVCPPELDKQWYINKAKERLDGFGIV